MGLTKAAFEPSWSSSSQQATAFASISDQLVARGSFQYFLAVIMTGSALSAIMSTADSVILGASSIVSIDVYKGLFNHDATTKMVVRIAELNSIVMAAIAFVLALNLSVGKMGAMIIFQNGMLMQLIPAYGMGAFSGISERAVAGGIVAGLLSLVSLVVAGNPLEQYVPSVITSVLVNFIVVFALQSLAMCSEAAADRVATEDAGNPWSRFGEQLCPDAIAEVMSTSKEPSWPLLALMLAALLLSIPWYGQPGAAVAIRAGLPLWSCVQVLAYVAVLLLGFAAVASWQTVRTAQESEGHRGTVKEQVPAEGSQLPTILQLPPSKADADAIGVSSS